MSTAARHHGKDGRSYPVKDRLTQKVLKRAKKDPWWHDLLLEMLSGTRSPYTSIASDPSLTTHAVLRMPSYQLPASSIPPLALPGAQLPREGLHIPENADLLQQLADGNVTDEDAWPPAS